MAASRPTVVYVVMLACSVVGLWVILALGRNLKPPPNLSGQWQLVPARSSSAKPASTMQVEQSGRFFQISMDGAQPFSMKMNETMRPSDVSLASNSATMLLSGINSSDSPQLTMNTGDGTHNGTWMLHRIKPPTDPQAVSRGAY